MFKFSIKTLLLCGLLSSLIYIGTDIFAATIYPGYSYRDQAVSELSAIGAPTQSLWTAMIFIFNPLLIAFGVGVYKSAKQKRSLKTTGIILSLWGIVGFAWLLFPMNMRGNIGSASDTGHLVMAGVTVFLILMFLGFGSNTQGKYFRLYSISTIILVLLFGALVGRQAPNVAAHLPTPWMGILERICVYSPMIWVSVLSIISLKSIKNTKI